MKELNDDQLQEKELIFNEIMHIEIIDAIKRDEEKGTLHKCPYECEECINMNTRQRDRCNALENIDKNKRCRFYKDYRDILKELWF